MASATGAAWRRNAIVDRERDQGLGREAQLVERAGDREVGLVAGVDPCALEVAAAGRAGERPEPPQVDVADQRHRDEVRHHATRRAQAERPVAVAHEVGQPADHLLLDERAHGARMPDVDALVGPLGEHLAGDRGDEGRRREVRERPRVVRVQRVGRDAGRELVEDRRQGGGIGRGPRRAGGSRRSSAVGAPRSRWPRRTRGPSPRRRASRGSPARSARPHARAPRARWRRRGCRSARAPGASGTGPAGRGDRRRRPSALMVGRGPVASGRVPVPPRRRPPPLVPGAGRGRAAGRRDHACR